MKYILLPISLICIWMNSFSQINVGSREIVQLKNPGAFSVEALTRLKESTTLFVYRESDKKHLDQLEKILKEVWTYNKIKLIGQDEFFQYQSKEGYSFFSLKGFTTHYSGSMSFSNTHFYLGLWMNNKSSKANDGKDLYCRIEMHPTAESYAKSTKTVLQYLYTTAHIYNWNLGFLKNYLMFVNEHLKESKERLLWEKMQNSDELKNLKTGTLYIPKYVLVEYGSLTGSESTQHNEKKLFKDYKHQYEMIDDNELSQKILNSSKAFYYLIYVKSSTDKFISVVNSLTGNIIYSKYKPISYNIKSSDIKELNKYIK